MVYTLFFILMQINKDSWFMQYIARAFPHGTPRWSRLQSMASSTANMNFLAKVMEIAAGHLTKKGVWHCTLANCRWNLKEHLKLWESLGPHRKSLPQRGANHKEVATLAQNWSLSGFKIGQRPILHFCSTLSQATEGTASWPCSRMLKP